jgi:hypothetical protein
VFNIQIDVERYRSRGALGILLRYSK